MNDWILPTIRLDRCTGCGNCITYCPTSAVEMRARYPVITRPEACAYCGLCEEMCPEGAITLTYEIVSQSALQQEKGKPE